MNLFNNSEIFLGLGCKPNVHALAIERRTRVEKSRNCVSRAANFSKMTLTRINQLQLTRLLILTLVQKLRVNKI